jgi:hypothetical protein
MFSINTTIIYTHFLPKILTEVAAAKGEEGGGLHFIFKQLRVISVDKMALHTLY